MSNGASKQQIQLAEKLSSEIFSETSCIDLISSSVVTEVIASDIHKTSLTPVTIGHNCIDFPCNQYFIVVESWHEILVSVKDLPFRSRDEVAIFILGDICPGEEFLEARTFGAAQVVVICSVTETIYRMDTAGGLHDVVTHHGRLFNDEASSVKD
jgi:hypothetical protein